MKHDHTRKNRADCQSILKSAEQHTGLELNRMQARGQAWSQPGPLVRGPVENSLIL